ncbi:hypothetical protein ACLB2K_006406 [Fragaria x ananassa]
MKAMKIRVESLGSNLRQEEAHDQSRLQTSIRRIHRQEEAHDQGLVSSRHKTRLHIGQLVKDTSEKLKLVSERDHHTEVIFYLVGSLKECWKYKAVNQQVASPPMPLVYQK